MGQFWDTQTCMPEICSDANFEQFGKVPLKAASFLIITFITKGG